MTARLIDKDIADHPQPDLTVHMLAALKSALKYPLSRISTRCDFAGHKASTIYALERRGYIYLNRLKLIARITEDGRKILELLDESSDSAK